MTSTKGKEAQERPRVAAEFADIDVARRILSESGRRDDGTSA